MSLSPDLVEMLSAFARRSVRYLVIGGHAVSLHARPRTTKDLDLWLDAAPENLERACLALSDFGVPHSLVEALRSALPDEIVWMGKVPSRVDFLQQIPGVEFAPAWERRVMVQLNHGARSSITLLDLRQSGGKLRFPSKPAVLSLPIGACGARALHAGNMGRGRESCSSI